MNMTRRELEIVLKRLVASGKVIIGKIRVNDGEKISNYVALSECPEKYREGCLRAFDACKTLWIEDVVYAPVFFANENGTNDQHLGSNFAPHPQIPIYQTYDTRPVHITKGNPRLLPNYHEWQTCSL